MNKGRNLESESAVLWMVSCTRLRFTTARQGSRGWVSKARWMGETVRHLTLGPSPRSRRRGKGVCDAVSEIGVRSPARLPQVLWWGEVSRVLSAVARPFAYSSLRLCPRLLTGEN